MHPGVNALFAEKMKNIAKKTCLAAAILIESILLTQLVFKLPKRGWSWALRRSSAHQGLVGEVTRRLLENGLLGYLHLLLSYSTSLVLVFLFCMLLRIERRKLTGEEIKVQMLPVMAIIGFGFTQLITLAYYYLPAGIKEGYSESVGSYLAGEHTVWYDIAVIVVYVIAAPIAEELFFRGLLLEFAQRHLNTVTAVLLCSAAFGIYHDDPVQRGYTFLLGIILCLIRLRLHSLYNTIVVHMTFNLLGSRLLLASLPMAVIYAGALVFLVLFAGLLIITSEWYKKKHT